MVGIDGGYLELEWFGFIGRGAAERSGCGAGESHEARGNGGAGGETWRGGAV